MSISLQQDRKSQSTLILLIRQMRPKQWTKNLLLFAALVFSFEHFEWTMALQSVAGFFLFCFTASCIYIINDYADREADRQHPEKRFRPMASGQLSPAVAIGFGIALLIFTMISAFMLDLGFALMLVGYLILNTLYSYFLKHVVIIDLMVIAACFVIRAISGCLVINVPYTPWFVMCTMLLALFLAISKRRYELEQQQSSHRKVLDSYSANLLDQLNSIVATATIISYSLFTFTSGNTIYLMWTIPLVIYGLFRYLYLIHIEKKGGKPEMLLLQDKHILFTVLLYGISVAVIITIFK